MFCQPLPGSRVLVNVKAVAWLVRDQRLDKSVDRELLSIKATASIGGHPITEAELEGILQWA